MSAAAFELKPVRQSGVAAADDLDEMPDVHTNLLRQESKSGHYSSTSEEAVAATRLGGQHDTNCCV